MWGGFFMLYTEGVIIMTISMFSTIKSMVQYDGFDGQEHQSDVPYDWFDGREHQNDGTIWSIWWSRTSKWWYNMIDSMVENIKVTFRMIDSMVENIKSMVQYDWFDGSQP